MPDNEWLLLHGGALGDLALSAWLTVGVAEVQRAGRLTVVSRVSLGDLSAASPAIRRVSADSLPLHGLFQPSAERDPHVQAALAAAFAGTRILNFLSDASTPVQAALRELGAAAVYAVDPRPRDGLCTHITEQWRRQLEGQGLLVHTCSRREAARRLRLPAEPATRGTARLAQAGIAPPTALLHPGAGGARKCWPLEGYRRVAQELRGAGVAPAFVLGPVETETWSRAAVESLASAAPLLVLDEPQDLLETLAAANAVVANDAGPAHLAALLGRPVVSLFGPTSAAVWRPICSAGVVFKGEPEHADGTWGIDPRAVARAVAALCGSAPATRDSAGSGPT